MTHTIPTLRRGGKRQEELLMTSVSWLTPPSTAHHSHQSELQTLPAPLLSPGINTCRPMSFQEDGAKVSTVFCPEWMEWWLEKSRIGPQLPECAYTTCKSGSYLPVSGGQLALVMAEVNTTNHCGQNTVSTVATTMFTIVCLYGVPCTHVLM